jgi:hypothetical protein
MRDFYGYETYPDEDRLVRKLMDDIHAETLNPDYENYMKPFDIDNARYRISSCRMAVRNDIMQRAKDIENGKIPEKPLEYIEDEFARSFTTAKLNTLPWKWEDKKTSVTAPANKVMPDLGPDLGAATSPHRAPPTPGVATAAIAPAAIVSTADVVPAISTSQSQKDVTRAPIPTSVTPHDIFTNVESLNLSPGTALLPGTEFTKTWKMTHFASGSEYEMEKVRLVHESEGLLGDACKANIEYQKDEIKRGETVQVSVAGLVVPDTNKKEIEEQWRFRDQVGNGYGQPLRLRYVSFKQDILCNADSQNRR